MEDGLLRRGSPGERERERERKKETGKAWQEADGGSEGARRYLPSFFKREGTWVCLCVSVSICVPSAWLCACLQHVRMCQRAFVPGHHLAQAVRRAGRAVLVPQKQWRSACLLGAAPPTASPLMPMAAGLPTEHQAQRLCLVPITARH